jgi:hypothetical protein
MPDDELVTRDEGTGDEVRVTNVGPERDCRTKAEVDQRVAWLIVLIGERPK